MEDEKISNLNILNDYTEISSNYEVLNNPPTSNAIVIPNVFNIIENDEKIEVQKMTDLSNNRFLAYKEWADSSLVTICPTVTLSTSMNKLYSNYTTRTYIINTLYNEMVNNRLTMICIDFKEIDDTEGLYRFLIEMVPRFKSAGMKVLIRYNNILNKNRLNEIVDYVLE